MKGGRMRRYPAGAHVRGGLYLDPSTGDSAVVPRRGGVLRGEGRSYLRLPIPVPLVLVLAPLVGLLYVIVMPFVGLALLVAMVCRKAWTVTGVGEALGAFFVRAHGRPGWAFLLGGRRAPRERERGERPRRAGGGTGERRPKEDA